MSKHYIAMAGLRGYLPSICDVYKNKADAVESMIFLHDLKGTRRGYIGNLKRDGYTELDLHEFGNEYIEIVECNCEEPHIHQSDMMEDEFYANW